MGTKLNIFMFGSQVGVLEQTELNRFVFTYLPNAKYAISLTMPVRTESYSSPFLHPVFQTNLPQGRLREIITNHLSKRMNMAGDLQVLAAVGGHLIGALQAIHEGSFIPRMPSPHSTEPMTELLKTHADKDFVAEFVSKHAMHSGVSGGFDKALATAINEGDRLTLFTERHIVKFDDEDHPSLSVIEFFTSRVAKLCDLPTANSMLSEDGKTLLVSRFDIGQDGTFAFEDMCSLLALPSDYKFMGSVEKMITAIKNYSSADQVQDSLRRFHLQYVACSMMRNGDAHLKNFGLLTSRDTGQTRLSPCYDMVSMSAYAPMMDGRVNDTMALTHGGTKRWLTQKDVILLGARCGLSRQEAEGHTRKVAESMRMVAEEARRYNEGDHKNMIDHMIACWNEGLADLHLDPIESCASPALDLSRRQSRNCKI